MWNVEPVNIYHLPVRNSELDYVYLTAISFLQEEGKLVAMVNGMSVLA